MRGWVSRGIRYAQFAGLNEVIKIIPDIHGVRGVLCDGMFSRVIKSLMKINTGWNCRAGGYDGDAFEGADQGGGGQDKDRHQPGHTPGGTRSVDCIFQFVSETT